MQNTVDKPIPVPYEIMNPVNFSSPKASRILSTSRATKAVVKNRGISPYFSRHVRIVASLNLITRHQKLILGLTIDRFTRRHCRMRNHRSLQAKGDDPFPAISISILRETRHGGWDKLTPAINIITVATCYLDEGGLNSPRGSKPRTSS